MKVSSGNASPGAAASLLDKLADTLSDPARRDRAMAVLLTVYAFVWTLYGIVAKSTQDIHFDMGEALVWSRESTWGTPKHPPLSGWIAGAWFAIFPRQDWAFYLLGMTLSAIALWAAWRIFVRWLPGDKAAVGVALLTFVPFYNFHELKFNANSVLVPLWALVTWTFLRSFQTRASGWAVLAGIAAAGAMLGKYWSIILLLALGIAALVHPARRAYLSSSAPWITIIVGFAVLAPHLLWLWRHDFGPVVHAVQTHQAEFGQVFRRGVFYVGSAIAYLAVPLATVLLVVRIRPAVLADIAAPRDDDRRMALLILLLPVALTLVAAFAAKSEVSPIWFIGGATLVPMVLLSSPRVELSRRETKRILAGAMVAPLVALLLSPVVALTIQRSGPPNNSAYYKLLATEVERVWGEASDTPLHVLGGSNDLINGASFYMPSDPATLDVAQPDVTPWADEASIAREGIAWVCRADDVTCDNAVAARVQKGAGWSKRVDVDLTASAFGLTGETRRFAITIVLPAGAQ